MSFPAGSTTDSYLSTIFPKFDVDFQNLRMILGRNESILEITRSEGFEVFELLMSVDESPRGWYWWVCDLHGIPTSDMTGPFDSEVEAAKDALGIA